MFEEDTNMTRFSFYITALILLTFGVLLSGCNDCDSITRNVEPKPLVISVSPQDGATDVSPAGLIVMKFNTPMNAMSVMEHFHCSGGDEMWEWMDSLQHHGSGFGRHMSDMDHMMEWMSEIEHHGEFNWNDEMTECEFHLDAGFSPHNDYMIYLKGDIRSQGGKMMDTHHMQYDGLMIHFRTGSLNIFDADDYMSMLIIGNFGWM
jgi:hypothetical protein